MILLVSGTLAAGWPDLVVAAEALTFEGVPAGSSETKTFTVANAGGMDMGLRVTTEGSPEITAAWSTTTCDNGERLGRPDDDVPYGAEVLVPPRCQLTVAVTYTPSDATLAAAELIVEAEGPYAHGATAFLNAQPAYAEDPTNWLETVLVTGTTDTWVAGDGELVAFHPEVTPDLCVEREMVQVEARAVGPTPLTWGWGTDNDMGAALWDNPFASSTRLRCPPAPECEAEALTLFVLVADADAHQVWGDGVVVVLDEHRLAREPDALASSACPLADAASDEADPGCEGGAAGALSLLGLSLRRRAHSTRP